MHIVNTMADIVRLEEAGAIPKELAEHLGRKLRRLHAALEPEIPLVDFSLEIHGTIAIGLFEGERSLAALGLPESLAEVFPEWISKLRVGEKGYHVVYIMQNNDSVVQLYLPDELLDQAVRYWLSEQADEEEEFDDEGDGTDADLPEPF